MLSDLQEKIDSFRASVKNSDEYDDLYEQIEDDESFQQFSFNVARSISESALESIRARLEKILIKDPKDPFISRVKSELMDDIINSKDSIEDILKRAQENSLLVRDYEEDAKEMIF